MTTPSGIFSSLEEAAHGVAETGPAETAGPLATNQDEAIIEADSEEVVSVSGSGYDAVFYLPPIRANVCGAEFLIEV
jgi:hypothetical protein